MRSTAVLLPFVAGDWREDEKLYMSLEASCFGSEVDREGELAEVEGRERLLVGVAAVE